MSVDENVLKCKSEYLQLVCVLILATVIGTRWTQKSFIANRLPAAL